MEWGHVCKVLHRGNTACFIFSLFIRNTRLYLERGVWGGFVGLVFYFKQTLKVRTSYEAVQKNAELRIKLVHLFLRKLDFYTRTESEELPCFMYLLLTSALECKGVYV